MQCLNPIPAWQHGLTKNGKAHYVFLPDQRDVLKPGDCDIYLPCGKCLACRYNRRVNWTKRLLSELTLHPCSSFFTLTYCDDHLPLSVPDKTDLQKFFKRLRHARRDYKINVPKTFRYFACLELGSKTSRPHYHGILFGHDLLSDCWQPYVATVKDGHPLFSSPIFESIWSKGFVSVDRVNNRVCNYVTKYILKQMFDSRLWFVYSRGLGDKLFIQNGSLTDLCKTGLDFGFVSYGSDGHYYRAPVPRNIIRKLETIDPDLYATLKANSLEYIRSNPSSRTASERVQGLICRLQKENEKRTLDNEQSF